MRLEHSAEKGGVRADAPESERGGGERGSDRAECAGGWAKKLHI